MEENFGVDCLAELVLNFIILVIVFIIRGEESYFLNLVNEMVGRLIADR